MKDCPSHRAFIATADGYESSSDVEDEFARMPNLVADSTEEQETTAIDSIAATAGFPSLIV